MVKGKWGGSLWLVLLVAVIAVIRWAVLWYCNVLYF
jgi:hypothetical protein